MAEIRAGDVVELKSGGPSMTYTREAGGTNNVVCQWFDGTKLQEGVFSLASLRKGKEPEQY